MTPKVMIVEDEQPLSLMLRYNLEAEGYAVDTVARGDEADERVSSRAQWRGSVWGGDAFVGERSGDVHVGRLRKGLGNGRDPIRTVRGSGYSFDEAFASAN